MKEYFRLQLLLNNRKLKDAGVQPVIAYLLLCAAFIGLSILLFYKSKYASYIYPILALTFITPLSEPKRNEFLKTCFGDNRYRLIRVIENLAIAFPFVAFLCYKQFFLMAAALLLLSILLALSSFGTQAQFTIPTPFGRKPFEFAVGFRNTFYLFVAIYALAAIAVWAGNFNLGVFALLAAFAIALSYYIQPEHEYYVWSHNCTPTRFMLDKIKTATGHVTLLTLPVLITLGVAFFNQAHFLLLFQLLGYVYICCIIAAKYSAYPNEMSLPQALLFALSICFPPALIFVLPYLVNRSIQRLQTILK